MQEPSHAVTEVCNAAVEDCAPLTTGKASLLAAGLDASHEAGGEDCTGAVADEALVVHAARFSSSAHPPHTSVVGVIEPNMVPSTSEMDGSNAAALETPSPGEYHLNAKKPACSDPGPGVQCKYVLLLQPKVFWLNRCEWNRTELQQRSARFMHYSRTYTHA